MLKTITFLYSTYFQTHLIFNCNIAVIQKCNVFARSRTWHALNARSDSCKKDRKKKLSDASARYTILWHARGQFHIIHSYRVYSPLHVTWSIAPSAGTNFLGSLLVARRFNPAGRRALEGANTPSIRDSR